MEIPGREYSNTQPKLGKEMLIPSEVGNEVTSPALGGHEFVTPVCLGRHEDVLPVPGAREASEG
jgi:hypothetical protein